MRRWVKVLAVVAIVGMVAAACSKPKSLESGKSTKVSIPSVEAPVTAPEVATSDPATTIAQLAANGGKATPGRPARAGSPNVAAAGGPGGRLTGGGDDSQARAVGAIIGPQSTARRKPYAQGVGEDTIQLDFSYDATSCGVNVVNAVTAAGGALPTQTRYYRNAATQQDQVAAENRESMDVMVRYWNDHAFEAADYAPKIRELMGNDSTHQFFGRKLVYKAIDGGSNQCPDKTTAAAKQASQEDKAFVVFTNFDGSANNMAAALNTVEPAKRPMHFGTLWMSDQIYSKYAPYTWTQFATGSTITRQWASYVCSKLRGPGALPARGRDVPDAKNRKFGLVHTNLPEDKLLAEEFKGYLNTFCGGNIITTEIAYEGSDFSKAQQDDPNVVLQLKLSGVTTVLMLTEPVQPLFQLGAAKGQDYYPEWVFSSYGYSDSNTVQRLYDQDEVKGSFGVSTLGIFGGFGFGKGDPFAMYHSQHLVSPTSKKPCDPSSDEGMNHDAQYCKAPTSLVTWYYTMLPLIGGILFAGPDLTPQNVTNGLQAYPTTRYGGNGPTSDPRPALVGAGKGKHGFLVDAVEWRWRPEFKSPPPESKDHWVEYPDCMRHYLQWPDKLAPNWETGGPNDGTWCGNKDGYPRVLPEDSNQ